MTNLLATIETKSNYKNLNGKQLQIREFLGNLVACVYYCDERKRKVTCDFLLSEIKEIREAKK